MKFENTKVYGFENAILGMRLPMCKDFTEAKRKVNSDTDDCKPQILHENDLDLMKRLIKADKNGSGQPNSKFLRMIHVQVAITAPTYFMAELDTYKISTVRNSTSFMHKGVSKPFEIEDFEVDEKIKGILTLKQDRTIYKDIAYPYETNEYKIYTTENGRQYEVYRNGRVFACPFDYTDNYGRGRTRHFERVEKKPSMTRGGYFQLNLGGRNCEKWVLHRLVAYVWLANPNNYETVDHLNGDKSNCSIENLEWVSRQENARREHKNGLAKRDIHTNYMNWKKASKVNPMVKLQIRKEYQNGVTQKDLVEKYGLSQAQISVICRDAKSTSEDKELFENTWFYEQILNNLNILREKYLETKDLMYFQMLRAILPMGYLYTSMFDCNYATLRNIYHQRKNHKLTEWHTFCDWIESLPYAKELIIEGE